MEVKHTVVVESPFAGDVEINQVYARFCMHDCLVNYGEAPYASHLLYTQEHVLNDDIPEERELGMTAGFLWGRQADMTVVYEDLGISNGMRRGIEYAESIPRAVFYRRLPRDLYEKFWAIRMKIAKAREQNGWTSANEGLLAD